ncbi:MAG: hypothetical protein R3B70_39570 [Polyangiaceae bacterium]
MRLSIATLLLPAFLLSACAAPNDTDDEMDLDDEVAPAVQPAGITTSTATITVSPWIGFLNPDPRVAAIDVQLYDAATDTFKVTVTVTNGSAGSLSYKSYPGGGELYLRAEDNDHYPVSGGGFPSTTKELARVPIPVIASGASWKVSKLFKGRSTFIGTLRPVPSPPDYPAPPPLNDSNLLNNEKSVSTLCNVNLTLTNAMLQANFPELSDIDAHLTFTKAQNPNLVQYEDGGNSHFTLGNLFSKSFQIHEIYLTSVLGMEYYYLPRHMQSTSSSLSIQNGSLVMCSAFETGGPEELYCAVDGGPDSNCPNANATQLQVCVSSPLSYDSVSHFVKAGDPVVSVNAAWNITIGLNYDVSDLVNKELKKALRDALIAQNFPKIVGDNLTSLIHRELLTDSYGNHGDITHFEAGDGAVLILGTAASDEMAYCPYP